ncbi:MAG: 5-(carboxyamino)imidazole ribonucleotide synthase [Actinomycetaceae bacterium]|nr:5-(carboxyamino)imidazole ribonucleotide synthase [Actinomycetaceae bacterium]
MEKPTVAVIGAGQLARMMQSAAIELGVKLRVLANDFNDPAAQVVRDTVIGQASDPEKISMLAEGASVVTYEHELIGRDILDHLAPVVRLAPTPQAFLYAQDKIAMRKRLSDANIPCPAWVQVRDVADVEAFGRDAGWPLVAKSSTGGYDGRGILVAHDLEEYLQWAEEISSEILIEERVPFSRELAIMAARNPSGEFRAWPVVQSVQLDGQCSEVIAPAPDLDEALEKMATTLAYDIGTSLDIVGVYAVELFEVRATHDRPAGLLVNELAMRPHNSGHWSIDGAVTSQFEQHLRAVLDYPLGETSARAPWSVMVNVLGSQLEDPTEGLPEALQRFPRAKIHLYGKANRPNRKLGHVTVSGPDLDICLAQAHGAADILMGVS